MEQAIPQPKQSSMGRNIFLATGIILLVGLVAVMAVNMQKIESVDLLSCVDRWWWSIFGPVGA